MIIPFKNKGSENLYDGLDTKAGRKILPRELRQAAGKKLDQYRFCFRWTELGAEDVEILDYH